MSLPLAYMADNHQNNHRINSDGKNYTQTAWMQATISLIAHSSTRRAQQRKKGAKKHNYNMATRWYRHDVVIASTSNKQQQPTKRPRPSSSNTDNVNLYTAHHETQTTATALRKTTHRALRKHNYALSTTTKLRKPTDNNSGCYYTPSETTTEETEEKEALPTTELQSCRRRSYNPAHFKPIINKTHTTNKKCIGPQQRRGKKHCSQQKESISFSYNQLDTTIK